MDVQQHGLRKGYLFEWRCVIHSLTCQLLMICEHAERTPYIINCPGLTPIFTDEETAPSMATKQHTCCNSFYNVVFLFPLAG